MLITFSVLVGHGIHKSCIKISIVFSTQKGENIVGIELKKETGGIWKRGVGAIDRNHARSNQSEYR